MGLILGILICLGGIPVAFVTVFATSDWETGLQVSSPWWIVVNVGVTELIGGLVILSHFYHGNFHW